MNDLPRGAQTGRTQRETLMCLIENEQSRKLATVQNHNTISQGRLPHQSSCRHGAQKERPLCFSHSSSFIVRIHESLLWSDEREKWIGVSWNPVHIRDAFMKTCMNLFASISVRIFSFRLFVSAIFQFRFVPRMFFWKLISIINAIRFDL